MNRIALFNEDNLEVMKRLPDESIDVICIDPPYLYLKNQKLERPFDEYKFFSECRRLLTKNGFIVMFGRGESFYRWNTILSELKFTFKEEIIWDKRFVSSPFMSMSRVHESISIFSKGKGKINRVKIPYMEMRLDNKDFIMLKNDIKRLCSAFGNQETFLEIKNFLDNNCLNYTENKNRKLSKTTKQTSKDDLNRAVAIAKMIKDGKNETSIIRTDFQNMDMTKKQAPTIGSRIREVNKAVTVASSLCFGMLEKSIIRADHSELENTLIHEQRDHYTSIHPTQKPVRLIERLLALVIPESKSREEIVVADFFAGSMSCMEAVHNMGMKGIACEIDQEYFEKGKERIEKLKPLQPELFR